MSVMHLYNPVGRAFDAGEESHQVGERLGSLQGKRIGFIDAMKPNAGLFLKYVEALMREKHLLPPSDTARKYVTPNMAIAHELDPAVQGVVVAWGD